MTRRIGVSPGETLRSACALAGNIDQLRRIYDVVTVQFDVGLDVGVR